MDLALNEAHADRPAPDRVRAAETRPSAPSTAGWLGALERSARIDREPHRTLPRVVEEMAAVHGARPALIGPDETLSYADLAARQNRYARWALAQGLQPGDTVALLMTNRPEYLAIWLGLTRVGITVALLNTNLAGPALAHCMAVAAPRLVIVAADLVPLCDSAVPHLPEPVPTWVHGGGSTHPRLDTVLDGVECAPIENAPAVSLSDRALLIYTSGTTGLPKAANVSHHRVMSWSLWFAGLLDAGPADRMYDCLPLYHSVGGVVATGSLLASGGSVVIRPRFSASRFWDDVVAHECTLFQYIGELCRYLVSAPRSASERSHRLRLCAGNGLRPDVWQQFQERFAVPRILEFYAATEGTVSLYNVEGRVGAVGRIPAFMAHRSPAAVVRFDMDRGEPLRTADGRCERVPRGEAGELIGRLNGGTAASAQRFEGYTSKVDSSRKVLRDVFAPGDAWMRTGDLMRQDDKGFFYFVDRVGDTYRWKGENVATTDVSQALSGAPGVSEVTVYGVAVPGMEGRAGMAALATTPDFDLQAFHAWVADRLPAYARPVFLRCCAALEVTETFKQKKATLVDEGFDPAQTSDPLFASIDGRYQPLDAARLADIRAGRVRL